MNAPLLLPMQIGEGATAHREVYQRLREALLAGQLPPGQPISIRYLAQMLGVSTTPVREALRDLATEGLVQFDPHRGAIVAELSSDDVHDIYEIRMVLEPLAMRQAVPHLSEALLERLRELHRSMLDEPHSADWVDRNRVFHMAVYETAASPRLAAIIRNLQDASVMYIGASLKDKPALRDEANHDHAEILAALESRDAEAAVAALTEHLRTAIDAFDETHTSG